MQKYIFKTNTTMKEYNNKKWWIDGNYVTEKRITADSLREALEKYCEQVKADHGITISKNAIACKSLSKMFIDGPDGKPVQVGFVITGKTDFQYDSCKYSEQYINLWVEILAVSDIDFEKEMA